MSLFPEFDAAADPPSQAARLGPGLRTLAADGVYFGTSSWKYEGWIGSIYSPTGYTTRGKFSKTKFEDTCLSEYAQTFPTVCGDFAFYQFPSEAYWARLFDATPEGFRFGFKVPEDITVARWPTHARYGPRAGRDNDHFLDAESFGRFFARRLEPYRSRVATLVFEFGTFNKTTFPTADAFLARLGRFLGALPDGFRFAVEVRNPDYLNADYFALLKGHNVAHVLSAWTRMPELGDQAELPGVFTADFTVVRALLSKGRTYEHAVQTFEPYELVREPNQAARDGLVRIAGQARARGKPAFLFVNNRLEGHAPSTIEAVVARLLSP